MQSGCTARPAAGAASQVRQHSVHDATRCSQISLFADKELKHWLQLCERHFPHDPNSSSIVPPLKLIGRVDADKIYLLFCTESSVPFGLILAFSKSLLPSRPPPLVANQFTCVTRHAKSCQHSSRKTHFHGDPRLHRRRGEFLLHH